MEETKQQIIDGEHLKVLSILYFVSGGLSAFGALVPLIYVGLGTVLLAVPEDEGRLVGAVLTIVGISLAVLLGAFAAAKIYCGLSLRRRKNRAFCFVVAAISCLGIPLGTALGIFTIIVLSRPTVASMFQDGVRSNP